MTDAETLRAMEDTADLVARVMALAERAERAEAEAARLREAANAARRAFAGYVNAGEAIRQLEDALSDGGGA